MSEKERYIASSPDEPELVGDIEKNDDDSEAPPPEVDPKTTDSNLRTLAAEYTLYGPGHRPGHRWGE